MEDKATGKDPESEISEQPDGGLPLPPLADPVISEIFKNVEVSGLAMRELINAVLADSGDKAISEVIDVIPQKIDPEAQGRSYRVDVTAKTADNEITIFEVQLSRRACVSGGTAGTRFGAFWDTQYRTGKIQEGNAGFVESPALLADGDLPFAGQQKVTRRLLKWTVRSEILRRTIPA